MNVVRHQYERWAAVRLPDSVQSVLFICKGNICRSPLAEAYFRSLVEKEGRPMTVRSAGLETTPGKPADARVKAVALEHRLSLDEHATTQVHMELLDQSDLIIVMEIGQKNRIQRLYPRSKGKVVLLGRFDSRGSLEIADPYSGTSEDFQSCFQQMSRCCDILAARLGVKSSEPAMSQVLPVNPENS
jgi:protein-tyrosine phosphatase